MADTFQFSLKYQQLLRDLKSTVEGLLVTQVANVWSIYGGLNRLHNTVEKIFKHGCKNSQNESGYYNFVQGLEWLQPENTKSNFVLDCEYRTYVPAHLKENKASIWLYRSLENHSLSQKLSWLLSDKNHLSTCYHSYSFLCQVKYAEATLICLRAVERNQASLMSEINPSLFLQRAKEFHRIHRRCSSFPDNHLKKIYEEKSFLHISKVKNKDNFGTHQREPLPGVDSTHSKVKLWHSMPSLQVSQFTFGENKIKLLSRTTPSTPVHYKRVTNKLSPSALQVDYNKIHQKSKKSSAHQRPSTTTNINTTKTKEVKHVLIDNQYIVEHTPSLSSSQGSTIVNDDTSSKSATQDNMGNNCMSHSPISVMDSFMPKSGEKDFKKLPKKTFIEDGGMSVLPMATGYFPKPTKGQSLLSFLTSGNFSKTNAELDRENAHFNISEAIISAMEQIKCKQSYKIVDEHDDSDPEIMDLKQRIRLRRTERAIQRHKKTLAASLRSDGRTDTATTVSPCSSTSEFGSEFSGSDEVEDFDITETSKLEESAGLSMSMASLYSEADLTKRARGAPDGASDITSAEGVALSLISKFSDKQLPRASDLEWLVSEEDAPQALLPLPKSWPVSPDSAEEVVTPLRGTQEWAPPRAQIIFTLHPSPSRKELMAKQNYRCAGCSMRVAPKYATRFRYCEYLGRYFCTGCHTNQLALIPGRVLQKWEFKRYPVSTFSYRLLEQMYTDPLFRIFELNKNIGKKAKTILMCRRLRIGLSYLKDFILTCKYSEDIHDRLEEMSASLTDPDVYSMEDLVKVQNGEMIARLKHLVEICCKHTAECKLCLARGFICEICNVDQVIFPWQMRIVVRCDKCGSCYHQTCWNPATKPCEKCLRIQKRKENACRS
ncbi:unnamed protein product [Phaedon cochleariae]|uniref:RUN domain-containing protein n=1 Tax=Phaedon cochleariae TaxID=80249 RepID=A0A9P0DU17_PHACE|nr:unnamed protein product [Phaedon cochleariae]